MLNHARRMLALAAATLAFVLGTTAFAAAPGLTPEAPPSVVNEAAPGLRELGSGTMRWFGIKVYDATLWTRGRSVDYAEPLALQLRYARKLKGAAIAQRSVEEMAKLGKGTPQQRAAWGEAMKRLFPDVDNGTTLTGVHLPGSGTRFFHDGKPLGEVSDPEFSRAFFGIWLDAGTSAPELRRALINAG